MNRANVILLVEDNSGDAELTLRAFRKSGVRNDLVVVRDGAEALDYLFAKEPPNTLPAVILLDLNLPKVSGVEVLRRLRADDRTCRIPVVVLTSSNAEKDLSSCYELGGNSFVRKPVDFAQFIAAAQQLGLYWLTINEPMT